MVERQLRRRGISDERVLTAMARVPRELFVPESLRAYAYDDGALPIGHRQTISQPFVVATICSLLALEGRRARPRRRHRLGVPGRGARRARGGGRDHRAHTRARRDRARGSRRGRLRRTSRYVSATARSVSPERAPFDAIAVAAAAPIVPPALYAQLADGGRVVVPRGSRWGQELVLVVRTPAGPVERTSIPCPLRPAARR